MKYSALLEIMDIIKANKPTLSKSEIQVHKKKRGEKMKRSKEKELMRNLRRRGIFCLIEPEFCIKKECYLTIFKEEDGAIWDERHPSEIELFHKLYRTYWGRESLVVEISTYPACWSMPKKKEFWSAAFDRSEFDEKEYRFIQRQIAKIERPSLSLNYCLKWDAFKAVYPERSEEFWKDYHEEQMGLFHKLFRKKKGRKLLAEEFIYEIESGHKDVYLTGFDPSEFSEKEYLFLQAHAACING